MPPRLLPKRDTAPVSVSGTGPTPAGRICHRWCGRRWRWPAAARALFHNHPGVRVEHADASDLARHGPFDLLVLDGGGQGKSGAPPLSPADWLRPGGLVVLDDFTPSTRWPPVHDAAPDTARAYWLTHPDLFATQINVSPTATTIVASYQPATGRRWPAS
jgi:hypothetical protein